MPLVQTLAPAVEPVTLADCYAQSRISDNNDDALLTLLISAVRRHAESITGRSFITQKWKLVLDSFPGIQMGGYAEFGRAYSLPANGIQLDKGVIQSVDSITYTAMDGTTQTVDPTTYVAELSGCPGRIAPAFGRVWPIPLPQIGAVSVNYTAGYGATAAAVPEGIRNWILVRIATLYENREAVAILPRGKVEPLPYVDGLLEPYTVVTA